jgi:hypothetical protein
MLGTIGKPLMGKILVGKKFTNFKPKVQEILNFELKSHYKFKTKTLICATQIINVFFCDKILQLGNFFFKK